MLIKAFKEHERRDGEKEGFAHTPADALAFKFYRDVSGHLPHQTLQTLPSCSASSATGTHETACLMR